MSNIEKMFEKFGVEPYYHYRLESDNHWEPKIFFMKDQAKAKEFVKATVLRDGSYKVVEYKKVFSQFTDSKTRELEDVILRFCKKLEDPHSECYLYKIINDENKYMIGIAKDVLSDEYETCTRNLLKICGAESHNEAFADLINKIKWSELEKIEIKEILEK